MSGEAELLAKNLGLILAGADHILARPEWFHCRLEQAYLAYWGGGGIPLGVLLLLWRQSHMTAKCSECGSTVYLAGMGSAPLGSSKGCWGACARCGRWANLRPDDIGGSFFRDNVGAIRSLMKIHGEGHLEERVIEGEEFTWKGLRKVAKKVKAPRFKPAALARVITGLASNA